MASFSPMVSYLMRLWAPVLQVPAGSACRTTCLKGTPQAGSALKGEEQLEPEPLNIQSVLSLRESFVRQHAVTGPHRQ
jgi:hypothetical protein